MLEYYSLNPAITLLLGDLVLSVVVGGCVALVRWLSRPQATRGGLARALLLWIGFLIGFSVLRAIFVIALWAF